MTDRDLIIEECAAELDRATYGEGFARLVREMKGRASAYTWWDWRGPWLPMFSVGVLCGWCAAIAFYFH